MHDIYFNMPARIRFKRGSLNDSLPEIGLYGTKILLVSGKNFIFSSGLFEKIKLILEENRIPFVSYSDVKPEPSVSDVENGRRICIENNCDCVLAVGGGSAMDVGKAIAVLAVNKGDVREYFGECDYENEPLPVIAVPTTCGTGSEVTKFAVIVDDEDETKKTISSEKIIPRLSILDPELLETLPAKLVSATGMDAFAHGSESFLSMKADYVSKMFALESLKILYRYLPESKRSPDNPACREKILLGSLLAGIALNKTGTIILHGMAYSLTIEHNVHHGTANALLLPYVFGYLKNNGYSGEIGELEEIWGETESLPSFISMLGLPSRLSELGISSGEIERLSSLAVKGTKRSVKNMKVATGISDYKKILESAL